MRDPVDADDVVQEAMIRAWSRRRSCRSPHAPIPWCLQITRHEAFRRLERRPLPPEHDVADLTAPGDAAQIDHVIDRVDIGRALAHLGREERILIALRYSHDYSQLEIARVLEIPEGTAKVRLHRVRKRLERLIEQPA